LAMKCLGVVMTPCSENPEVKATPISDVVQKQGPQIIARVAGEEITREELEGPLASRLHDFELQAYRLKEWQLENLIGRKVLQKEAEERGITLDQMIKDEHFSQGIEVSEAAEADWCQKILDTRVDPTPVMSLCTPSRMNNEGDPASISPLASNYGAGMGDFFAFKQALTEWWASGDLPGLELEK